MNFHQIKSIQHCDEEIKKQKQIHVGYVARGSKKPGNRKEKRGGIPIGYNAMANIHRIEGIKKELQTKLSLRGLVEIEFQDIPMGEIFWTYLSIESGTNYTEYEFIKTCGLDAVILTDGFDKGSLVTFEGNKMIMVKKSTRKLVSDTQSSYIHNQDACSGDWDGV
jgi:hypothetical protein